MHLIGLLTFGIVDIPEYELVLAKAICGARFEEPLEPVELENDDLVACDALLERVDSGYLLTIERRAQDVLLARLPWGCGVVALPWLAERMFVRWLD